jgi:hypothetical protein
MARSLPVRLFVEDTVIPDLGLRHESVMTPTGQFLSAGKQTATGICAKGTGVLKCDILKAEDKKMSLRYGREKLCLALCGAISDQDSIRTI